MTQEELELLEEFEKGFKDDACECLEIYDFGTKRQGFTPRVIEKLKEFGNVINNNMSYGVEFKRG